jgi:hypothetical protein
LGASARSPGTGTGNRRGGLKSNQGCSDRLHSLGDDMVCSIFYIRLLIGVCRPVLLVIIVRAFAIQGVSKLLLLSDLFDVPLKLCDVELRGLRSKLSMLKSMA